MIEPIPEALRHLVEEESTAPVTTARAQAAVRAKLGATLGIAVVATTGAATGTATAGTTLGGTASTVASSTVGAGTVATTTVAVGTTAAVKTALSIKLVGIVLGVGAAGAVATTVAVTRDRSEPARPAIVERAAVEQPSPPPRHPQPRVEPIDDVTPAPVVVEEPPRREPPRRTTAKAAPVKPAAPVRSQSQLLADASRALSQGNAARALALIEEDTKHHGIGPLIEEREALRISVLSALGRNDDARQAARRLLATFPNTIHRRLAEQTLAQEAP